MLPFSPPSALHDSEGRDPVAKLAAAAALLGRGGAVTRGARGSCFLRALTCLQPSARGALAPPLSPRSAIYGSDGRDPAVALDAPAVLRCMRLVPGVEDAMTALLAVECRPRRTAILPTERVKWAARTSCGREPFQFP